jgi:hypothetical protein
MHNQNHTIAQPAFLAATHRKSANAGRQNRTSKGVLSPAQLRRIVIDLIG